jgi:hypothetical protein
MHIKHQDLRTIAHALQDDPPKLSPRSQWAIVSALLTITLVALLLT